MFLPLITKFLSDESGAVTADFVPLIAATVGLGLAATGVVSGGVEDASTDIASTMSAPYLIQTSFASQRMTLISSNDVVTTISGATLCASYACDPSQTYSELAYTTSDGESLTRYWAYGNPQEVWVAEDGTALDYIPEQADGFCSGRCPVVVDDKTPIRLIDKGGNRVPGRTSARIPIQ